jgi:uncharacterized lipoprotein YmbA
MVVNPVLVPPDYSISIGPVTLPATVDRPQMVVQTGPNQVWIDEFHRWASPLQNDIARVLVENIATLLGTPRASAFPQSTYRQIYFDLYDFIAYTPNVKLIKWRPFPKG